MQSSARRPASGRGSGGVVVTMNGFGSSGSSSRKRGASGGDQSSWVLLVAVLGIGYAMGSTPMGLPLGAIWKGIIIFEELVREIIVPLYTLGVVLYLLARFYGDRTRQQNGAATQPISKPPLAALRASLSFFSRLPGLRKLSTMTILEEDLSSMSSSPLTEQVQQSGEDEAEPQGDKPIDMNGVFHNVENDNFGDFLKAQGVPWFLCSAASKARPTHHIKHKSLQKVSIKIKGIIESETAYHIDGPFTETTIRGRVFQDTLSYLYDEDKIGMETTSGDPAEVSKSNESEYESSGTICVGLKTRKIAVGEGYEVHVERRIIRAGTTWIPSSERNPDGHCTYDLDTPRDFDRLLMANKIVYDGENGASEAPIIASQLFYRTD